MRRFALMAVLLPVPAAAQARVRGFDVDGDGYADAILDGRRIFRGGPDGLTSKRTIDVGPPKGSHLGLFQSISFAGDVNGDGFSDVVFGDPACPDITKDRPACGVGHAYLYLGGKQGVAATPAVVLTAPHDRADTDFGRQVVAAGDVDGDGFGDLVIVDRDGAHLYRGAAGGLVTEPIELPHPPRSWISVAPAGDLDGDGRADLVILGPQKAVVWYGGPPRAQDLGRAYDSAAAGDFDGDGFGDLALGAIREPGEDGPGRVVVYRGGKHGLESKPSLTLAGETRAGAEYGLPLASPGDLDGDGKDDLVVVASCAIFDAKGGSCTGGRAWLYLGGPRGLGAKAVATLAPERKTMWITGTALVPVGDCDGDKHADFVFAGYLYRGAAAKGALASTTPPPL